MKAILTVLLVIFLDLLGFSFIIPFLPDYVHQLGGSPLWFSWILGAYSIGQFLMAPVWGRLSDKVGRKPILVISTLGSTLAWTSLALVHSLVFLLIVRFIAGLMSANFTVAQSYIVDVSPPEKRTSNLGLTGMAFGIGFILGPPSGGFLYLLGPSAPFWGSALLAASALTLVLTAVPESKTKIASRKPVAGKSLLGFLKDPVLRGILLVNLGFSLAFSLFQSMFSQVSILQLHFAPWQIGASLAFAGVLIALTQGGGLRFLVKRYAERPLMWVSLLLCGVGLILWGFATVSTELLVSLVPISLGGGIATVLIRSLMTKSVSDHEVGTALGISSSLDSFSRVVGPLVGGVLVSVSAMLPGLISGVMILLSVAVGILVWGWNHKASTDSPEPAEASE